MIQIHTKGGLVEQDPEYQRCIKAAEEARDRGELSVAQFWQRAAIKRGDELLTSMGSTIQFGWFFDLFNKPTEQ